MSASQLFFLFHYVLSPSYLFWQAPCLLLVIWLVTVRFTEQHDTRSERSWLGKLALLKLYGTFWEAKQPGEITLRQWTNTLDVAVSTNNKKREVKLHASAIVDPKFKRTLPDFIIHVSALLEFVNVLIRECASAGFCSLRFWDSVCILRPHALVCPLTTKAPYQDIFESAIFLSGFIIFHSGERI